MAVVVTTRPLRTREPVPSARGESGATRAAGPECEFVLEDQVGHLLRRAHQRHAAIFQDNIGDGQLTPTQFAAMVKILELGEASQNHLGRLTAMDPATIQGVIQRLEGRGLVERGPDPEDRRLAMLRLTDAGRALVRELIPRAKSVSELSLAPLDSSERKALLALLRKLA